MPLVIALPLIVSVVILLILLRNSLIREATLERTNSDYETYFANLQSDLSFVLSEIKSIDIRGTFQANSDGAFERDDEVGIVFKAIYSMINSLSIYIEPEESDVNVEA